MRSARTRRWRALVQDFERRVRESRDTVAFTEAELEGVPAQVWRTAKRDAGRVRLGLDYPTADPVIPSIAVRGPREHGAPRCASAVKSQPSPRCGATAELRRDYARPFGSRPMPIFVMRRRMVKSAAEAGTFLDLVAEAGDARERAGRRAARGQGPRGRPLADTAVRRWDVATSHRAGAPGSLRGRPGLPRLLRAAAQSGVSCSRRRSGCSVCADGRWPRRCGMPRRTPTRCAMPTAGCSARCRRPVPRARTSTTMRRSGPSATSRRRPADCRPRRW